MLTNDELWEKAATNEPISREDIGLPSWRSECDGFIHELQIGFAYKHKDGYRWTDGSFLTKKQIRTIFIR